MSRCANSAGLSGWRNDFARQRVGFAPAYESMTEPPSPNTRRWVARRKAAVVAAVTNGVITIEEACHRYQMSEEEFFAWQRAFAPLPPLSRSRPVLRTAGMGHFHPYAASSAIGCRAPNPDLYAAARERASFELCGDSAPAERSAGQHAHPHRAFRFVNRCVSAQS